MSSKIFSFLKKIFFTTKDMKGTKIRILELIRIVFVVGSHGQAKLDRGTQISTVAGEKSVKNV